MIYRRGFIMSLILHFSLLIVGYFGLPHLRKDVLLETPIMIEVVNVDEVSNAPAPQITEEKEKEPEEPKEAEKEPEPEKPEPQKQEEIASPPPPPPPAPQICTAIFVIPLGRVHVPDEVKVCTEARPESNPDDVADACSVTCVPDPPRVSVEPLSLSIAFTFSVLIQPPMYQLQ